MEYGLIEKLREPASTFDDFVDAVHESDLRFMAGNLEELADETHDEIEHAVERAIEICIVNNIPLQNHFKSVFISSDGSEPYRDWKLSQVGRLLVTVNASAHNQNVGKLQLELIKHFLKEHD